MDLGLSGLASSFDWRSLIDQISDVERLPQRRLLAEQNLIEERNTSYGSIATQLAVLQNRVNALKSPDLYAGRLANVADTSVASATVASGALAGSYRFQFNQLATAARQTGQAGAGGGLHPDADVSGLVVGEAGFASPLTAGTFRVNGAVVDIATTDTLQAVFDKIGTATGGAVTASYDPAGDRIRLASASPIVLGSATDTSNFLEVAQLSNNGTGTVTSGGALGSIRLSAGLENANFATAVTDGGAGAGAFRINGVEIGFATTDSVAAVLERINKSAAGVVASYDGPNDRFVLTNKGTGDVGIALEDVTGNFLAATGLSSGTLERGKDLLYTLNDGGVLRSRSNSVTESSSGIAGLSVTALKEGASTTVTVSADTAKVRTAITEFIDEYNRVQSKIASETATSTDAEGKVTASTLAAEGDAEAMASNLRRLVYSSVSGLAGTLSHLESLGIASNSEDDTLKLTDSAKLDGALANRIDEVRALWSDATNGIAVRLGSYLDKTIGDEGTLGAKQALLTRQSAGIDTQIADLERVVQANRQRMVDSFINMEKAQASINQQMQFLLQRYGVSNS